jgi:hypothetical protein
LVVVCPRASAVAVLVGDTVGVTEAAVADWAVASGVGAMTTALPTFAAGG